MSSFRKHTLTVKRRASGDYDSSGFFKVSGPNTEFTISASVQPMTGSEMLLLPENRRELETKKNIYFYRIIWNRKRKRCKC